MRAYELSRDGGLLADAIAAARRHEAARTGLHCSTIVNDLMRMLDPKTYDNDIDEATCSRSRSTATHGRASSQQSCGRRTPGSG